MKRRFLKIVSAMLACTLAFSLPACKKKKTDPVETEKPLNDTDIVLVENGATEYKAVVPADATEKERLAGTELKEIFEQVTGAVLEVSDDTDAAFDENDKVISIGDTAIFDGSGETVPDSVGSSGFMIKRRGNTVLINGGYYGDLYGVYEFLERNLGIRLLGFGEIYETQSTDRVLLKDFDHTYTPDFTFRATSGLNLNHYDDVTNDRLRLTNHENWIEGLTAHTTMILLPFETYGNNESWYSAAGTEICFTSEGALNQMAENLKTYILNADEQDDTIMIGGADNSDQCNCETCRASYEANGGYTGTYLIFLNKLAEKMEQWETENDIRHFTYVGFAYRKTQTAPATYDRATDTYTPIVTARHNVAIRLAPLDSDFNHLLTDTTYNASAATAIRAWQACADNFKVWSYMLNFHEELVWFNDFHTTKANYKIYYDMGAREIYDQGQWNNMLPAFVNLRLYVKSRLMWDLDADPTAAAQEFIAGYYKEAAPYMQELWDIVNLRYRQINQVFVEETGRDMATRCYTTSEPELMTDMYWPYEFLMQCKSLTNRALAAAEAAGDAELAERVRLESITADYLLLTIHFSQFSYGEYRDLLLEFRNNCSECGVESYAESGAAKPISEKIDIFNARLPEEYRIQ